LEVAGLVDNKKPWTLEELHALPEVSQITRTFASRAGAPSARGRARIVGLLQRVGADTRAKYVWFKCAEGYTNTIDMATALHSQTQMTFKFDNKILPRSYGFPMKIRIPTKLASKIQICRSDGGHERRQRRLLGRQGLQLVQRSLGERSSVIKRAPR
jgi:DMSO/TMAO reductase YedYZ molybdopterin-dependent catalytic subunit